MATSPTPSTTPPRGLDRIPAHILYPGMVVMLLVGSVCAQMILLSSAISDGGAQVEPHYYDRAVDWEDEQSARARIDDLGYTFALHDTPEVLELELQDAARQPLKWASGTLTLTRPHLSQSIVEHDLSTLPSTSSGRLQIARPHIAQHGLWDVTVRVKDEQGRVFLRTFRRQW
jgi:nitrogen fixation protein FixH